MQVKSIAVDLVRERLPQLLQQARDHFGNFQWKRPNWPAETATAHWINGRAVLAGVLLGGIIHICATFAAPLFWSGHAYQLLSDQLPANRMVVLPPLAPGKQVLPELPPDMLYAMCRYDLHQGSVAVSATVQGPGWALSVHTPSGSNFYVLPGQPARSTDVSFVLVPPAPDPTLPHSDATAESIASPTLEGVVILRAPVRGLAWTAETEAVLKRASCAVVKQ